MVVHNDFRKAKDLEFCRSQRLKYNTRAPTEQFSVAQGTLVQADDGLEAHLLGPSAGCCTLNKPRPLDLRTKFYQNGTCRLEITESEGFPTPRWQPPHLVEPGSLQTCSYQVLQPSDERLMALLSSAHSEGNINVSWAMGCVLSVKQQPLQFELYCAGQRLVTVNSRGLMHFRQRHSSQAAPAAAEPARRSLSDLDRGGRGSWRAGRTAAGASRSGGACGTRPDSFGKHRDSRPHGDTSVGIDVTFHRSTQLYGIPEHASSMALKNTRGEDVSYSEPYRLYTLDATMYELDSPMALYGTVPLIISHHQDVTCGVFWCNLSDTFVDVARPAPGMRETHWMSESGNLDLFLLPGPTPRDVFCQYAELTGKPYLPPLFSLGYHQCRWNYNSQQDVMEVHKQFLALDMPCDVIWLDIEHTDCKRYFTWDKKNFPDPVQMQQALAEVGREMVAIVDPHLKADPSYKVFQDARHQDLLVKNPDKSPFIGDCWPGRSAWVDYTNPRACDWWAGCFSLDKWPGTTKHLHVWIDMNEPMVFGGPEGAIPKDCVNFQGIESREWHSAYGTLMQEATFNGLVRRGAAEPFGARPFVLSRSFCPGAQKYGAVWTGDNHANWEHLAAAGPMLLTLSVCGLPFVGSDAGGHFGDPSPELFVRWMQAAAYTPFFRSHCHQWSKRREPWVFGDPYTSLIRTAILERYSLLPYWYTLFYKASQSGLSPMRPLWVHYPQDRATFTMDNQWLVGEDLLVCPVTQQGAEHACVYFPGGGTWYDVRNHSAIAGGGFVAVEAPLGSVPVYQRAGSILPRKSRVRPSSRAMAQDPYTLMIALDHEGNAAGKLYVDDGHSFAHQDQGDWALVEFVYSQGTLTSSVTKGREDYQPPGVVNEVIIMPSSTSGGASSGPATTSTTSTGRDVNVATLTRQIQCALHVCDLNDSALRCSA